jgi:hypothetical protein
MAALSGEERERIQENGNVSTPVSVLSDQRLPLHRSV